MKQLKQPQKKLQSYLKNCVVVLFTGKVIGVLDSWLQYVISKTLKQHTWRQKLEEDELNFKKLMCLFSQVSGSMLYFWLVFFQEFSTSWNLNC